MGLKESIRKYALQNAVEYDGKANPGSVIGKLLAEDHSLKKKMKDVSKEVKKVVAEVNKMKIEEQKKEFKKYKKKIPKKKKEEKKRLPELKNAKKVVMRFSPSPSGPMHLGHSYPLSLNSEYCRKYKGKLILRIEDTNPETIYEPAYGMLPEDAKWVTKDNIGRVVVQSDRLGLYYDYAEKLVDIGKAYVCECTSDHFRELIFEKKACPCRDLPLEEHQKRYAKMFNEYKPGEAVLRIKTDIKHKNPAMRDFPLMRINDHVHPRWASEKHELCPPLEKGEHSVEKDIAPRVWPLMNLAVFVDDVEMGVTHVLRAKDHIDNAKRQEFLYRYLEKDIPETIFVGKINFEGMPMSCSKVKKLIEEGKYEGWSDIRLPFLAALKRRGYQPDALIKYSLDVGVSQNDKSVTKEEFFKALDHFNKEVLDDKTNRYFFIEDPKEIKIDKAPKQRVELDLHPDHPKRGKREFYTDENFYIANEEFKNLEEGELVRLMDCLNFRKEGKKFVFDSTDYEKFKKEGRKIIHWLPVSDDLVTVNLLMPDEDKTLKIGIAEPLAAKLKEEDIVQFERVGFVRLDKKEKDKLVFWYGHR
ncbi:glutamate--tRNA ligase [Candidatus Woesearchaeota archaeon]|nr:glutamate--tRNA ligase [Candidatus Woesearchaeota archaeon]